MELGAPADMCGRYTHRLKWREIHELYRLTAPRAALNLRARYNVAPTQRVPIIRDVDDGRECIEARWGLIPSWSKDGPASKFSTINAIGEEVATKPTYRGAWKASRRCIVSADGFIEWEKKGKDKLPWLFTMQQTAKGDTVEDAPMALAGLYETWKGKVDGQDTEILSTTILTTAANELLARVHNRMPVILDEGDWDEWLDPKTAPTRAQEMVKPFPAYALAERRISTRVNSARVDEADCLAPA